MILAYCANVVMLEDLIHYPFIEDELPKQGTGKLPRIPRVRRVGDKMVLPEPIRLGGEEPLAMGNTAHIGKIHFDKRLLARENIDQLVDQARAFLATAEDYAERLALGDRDTFGR